jgi:glutathione S-transferase
VSETDGQNLMENLPSFLVTFNIAAAMFPKFASGLGLVWSIGRVFYHIGYSKKGPGGRSKAFYVASMASMTLVISLQFVC